MMESATIVSEPVRGLLLQRSHSPDPHQLEIFMRSPAANAHHFYCHGLSFVDFADLFEEDLKGLTALIYRIPTGVLNPNYWEPYSKEAETVVREKMTGIITKSEGDRTFLWRSDQVPKARLLRDGLDVDAELFLGFALRVSGEGLLTLGRADAGRHGRFEWAAFSEMPPEPVPSSFVLAAHQDVTRLSISVAGEKIVYASHEDHFARIVFSDEVLQERAVSAAVRGFVANLTGCSVAPIARPVLREILRVSDGLGLTAQPDFDFVNKDRSYEVNAFLGKTEWGTHRRTGRQFHLGDEKILIYYDRTSGFWAVTS